MPKKKYSSARRKFLKASAAGAAGMVVSSLSSKAIIAGSAGFKKAQAWEDGMQINPEIDNLRVVFCHDPAMAESDPVEWTQEGQNGPVNTEKVQENMDKMAIALAQKPTATEAWNTIFQNPGKDWNLVNVAIKINPSPSNLPRLSIIDKVCRELNRLGVEYGNMTLFDQNQVMPDSFDTAYVKTKIPEEVKVERYLGGTGEITLSTGEVISCADGLASGTVDLMVNIAQNKGCLVEEIGNFTLTMKSHMGSMRFGVQGENYAVGHTDVPGGQDKAMEMVVAMNQHDAVLGGTPPRQQLCIIDSLWAMNPGPYGQPEKAPYCLVMGTFGPIVDYLTIEKIRKVKPEAEGGEPYGMGVTDTVQSCVETMVNGFGYDINSQEIQELDFTDALTYEPPVSIQEKEDTPSTILHDITVSISLPGRSSSVTFSQIKLTGPPKIEIYDMLGTLVRDLAVPAVRGTHIPLKWDGTNSTGFKTSPGWYTVRLLTGRQVRYKRIRLPG